MKNKSPKVFHSSYISTTYKDDTANDDEVGGACNTNDRRRMQHFCSKI